MFHLFNTVVVAVVAIAVTFVANDIVFGVVLVILFNVVCVVVDIAIIFSDVSGILLEVADVLGAAVGVSADNVRVLLMMLAYLWMFLVFSFYVDGVLGDLFGIPVDAVRISMDVADFFC